MHTYSDEELETMLHGPESDIAERKESFKGDSSNKVRQAVCAFANDLPDHRKPGVVFIGVRDNGKPSALPITDELLLNLGAIKTDGNILPPPTLFVERRTLLGSPVAVITVLPADSPPVRYKGNIEIRTGPRRGVATTQDERILNEKRRFRDRPYDIQPVPGASVENLNQRFFEESYLPAAVSREALEANERNYPQRLAATKMVLTADDPVPTILGILVLGTTSRDFIPGAYIQFLRISDTRLEDPVIDEAVIDGAIHDTLRRIDEKITSHNRTSIDYTSGPTEARRQPYPLAALQQLVRNAVMHRTYESTNAPVRFYWFDDRIEIMNPGGPFGAVTSENFGQPGVADYRNPNLAEALRVLGFVQRFGAGISTARRALSENGNPPPSFEVNPTTVLATIRAV